MDADISLVITEWCEDDYNVLAAKCMHLLKVFSFIAESLSWLHLCKMTFYLPQESVSDERRRSNE